MKSGWYETILIWAICIHGIHMHPAHLKAESYPFIFTIEWDAPILKYLAENVYRRGGNSVLGGERSIYRIGTECWKDGGIIV